MQHAEVTNGSSIKRYYNDPENGRPFDAYLCTLYFDGFLCDVDLKVGFTVIPAHRIILASASDYFRKQFENETTETLDLTSVFEEAAIMNIVLLYIYKGEITLSTKVIHQLLKVLDQIDIKSLKEHCAQFLMVGLRPINGFETWELAWRHNMHQLATVCLLLCRETLCHLVLHCESVKDLSPEFLKFVLNAEEIMINLNSVHVIKLIIQWLSHNPTSRILDAKHLLGILLYDSPLLEREYDEINLFMNSCDGNLSEIIIAYIDPLLQQHIVFMTPDNHGYQQIVDIDNNSTQSDNPEDNAACRDTNSLLNQASTQEILRTENPQHRTKDEWKMHMTKSDDTNHCQRVQTALYTTMDGKRLKVRTKTIPDQLRDSRENVVPNWSAIVQESNNQTIALYCSYNDTWRTTHFPISIHDPIGFVGDLLACKRDSTVIILYNLEVFSWMILPLPFSAANCKCDDIPCLGNLQPAFFTYSGLLYSICAVTNRIDYGLSFVLNKWERTQNLWIYVTTVYTSKYVSDVLTASLSVKTSSNSNVYLMATVTTLYSRKTSDISDIDDFVTCNRNETETKVSMKPNEIFYVFKIDMETLIHEEIGVRFSEPTNLDDVPILILEDRILFVLDSLAKLHENFQYSFYYRTTYTINGLVLHLKDKNTWSGVALGIPLPPFYDLPIKKLGKMCFAMNISFSKNFVFIGMHRAPHIFQVAVYDVSRFEVNILGPIPLPSIKKMLLFSIDSHQPSSMTQNDIVNEVDLLSYHFKDWQLKDWCGSVE